jgi:hypothetical protein
MTTTFYIINYILILIFLILFQYLNKDLYYIFGLLFYTYALTNLYTRQCFMSSA